MNTQPSMTATTIKNLTAKSLAAIALASGITLSASADPNDYEDKPQRYAANDFDFRAAHPIKVFVNVRKGGGNREAEDRRRYAPKTWHQLGYHLPDYVRIVDSPRYADLVVRVREVDYDLNFRVIDVDRKDKKYKKSRRYTGGRCGIYHKAYYTKIKEKGEAYASYDIKVNLKGIGRDRDYFTLRSAENFSYGTELRANTNCGMRPTNHMPSNGVAKLFRRASDGYRHHVAREIREEATRDLSRKLAHNIRKQADYYYTDLAARLSYGDSRYDDRDEDRRSRGGFYFGFYKQVPQVSGGYGR